MTERASSSPLWTIGFGTLSISAASGIFTGARSIYKNKPDAAVLTGAAVLNSGSTAFVFFACRELVAGPLLSQYAPGKQYAQRRKALGHEPLPSDENYPPSQFTSRSDLRCNNLLDSGLSGVFTGGLLRGIRSGPRASISGALIVGAACTVLQYGYNELNIMRLGYVSGLQESGASSQPKNGEAYTPGSDGAFQSLMKLFGVLPVSDDEYLARLKNSRDLYRKRITVLEAQLEEEKLLKEMIHSQDTSRPT